MCVRLVWHFRGCLHAQEDCDLREQVDLVSGDRLVLMVILEFPIIKQGQSLCHQQQVTADALASVFSRQLLYGLRGSLSETLLGTQTASKANGTVDNRWAVDTLEAILSVTIHVVLVA